MHRPDSRLRALKTDVSYLLHRNRKVGEIESELSSCCLTLKRDRSSPKADHFWIKTETLIALREDHPLLIKSRQERGCPTLSRSGFLDCLGSLPLDPVILGNCMISNLDALLPQTLNVRKSIRKGPSNFKIRFAELRRTEIILDVLEIIAFRDSTNSYYS